MSVLNTMLIKRARQIKEAFQPMPGGQPPADPNAQGGAGAPPMDPSMMGGAPVGAPMDPSMMGGAPGGMPAGAPPMDPSMMGGMMPPGMGMPQPMPATIGQLSITDFQNMLTDMLTLVMQQIMGTGPSAAGAGAVGMPPPEVAPQEDNRAVSNTEISEKLDALLAMLGGGTAGADAGAAPDMGAAPAGPDMGFGGQSMGSAPMAAPAGMEPQASAPYTIKKASLADMILRKTTHARRS